jgi:NADH-quinone oxidoreductase E subunit
MSTCTCCQHDNQAAVQAAARAALPAAVVVRIDQALALQYPAGELIAVLHLLQSEAGFIGRVQMDAVAQLLGVPAAKVSGVATFYHFFRLQPAGRFQISVCTGTACYVKGADKVVAKLVEELGIDLGETTSDGLFSLVQARCLGMCGLAPVLMVNDEVYQRVSPEDIPKLIKQYADQAHPAAR